MQNNSSKSKRNIIFNILIIIAVILFIISFAFFIKNIVNVKNNKKEYKELSELVVSQTSVNESDEDKEESYDFSKLIEKNPDFVGWINVPNTNINHPVVKTNDNKFYLKRDFNKKYTARGAVYMDYRNNPDDMSKNTIIYGHNCYDGTMFSDIDKFDNIYVYKKSPYFEFINNNGKNVYKIYGVFIASASADEDNGYVFYYNTPNFKNDFNGFVDEINKRRIYITDVDINSDDELMILSTCTRKMDYTKENKKYKADGRIVIVGRKLRENEDSYVDVSKAYINENTKYSQVWYDKNKTENPYKNDKGWFPGEAD